MKKSTHAEFQPSLPELKRDSGVSFRAPLAIRKRARTYAVEYRTTLQEVAIAALDEYLKKRGA